MALLLLPSNSAAQKPAQKQQLSATMKQRSSIRRLVFTLVVLPMILLQISLFVSSNKSSADLTAAVSAAAVSAAAASAAAVSAAAITAATATAAEHGTRNDHPRSRHLRYSSNMNNSNLHNGNMSPPRARQLQDGAGSSSVDRSSSTGSTPSYLLANNNKTSLYAEMTDGNQTWKVLRRTRDDLHSELWEINEEKYMPRNDDELSIFRAYGLGSVLEMEDPKGGRSAPCFERYFKIWQDEKPFSGEAFFDWLDYGSGRRNIDRFVINERKLDCRKGFLPTFQEGFHGYYHMSPDEIQDSVVYFRPSNNTERSLALVSSDQQQTPVKPGWWLFVWSVDRRMHIMKPGNVDSPHGPAYMGHCSPTGGRPVLHAGELKIGRNGKIMLMNAGSGHYRPDLRHIRNFYLWLRDHYGITQQSLGWRPLKDHQKKYGDAFTHKWNAVFM